MSTRFPQNRFFYFARPLSQPITLTDTSRCSCRFYRLFRRSDELPDLPQTDRPAPKRRLLVVLSGGGWHRQTVRFLEQFDPGEFEYFYVYGHHSGNHSTGKLPTPHPGPRLPMHYIGPTRKTAARFITNPLRLALSFVEAFRIIHRTRPDVVAVLGSALSVPLLTAAKLFRTKTVFIESLTRVEQLSRTGRLLYTLRLANRLYVQSPPLADRFPRTTFAGAVL